MISPNCDRVRLLSGMSCSCRMLKRPSVFRGSKKQKLSTRHNISAFRQHPELIFAILHLLICVCLASASRYKIPRAKSGVRFVQGDARQVDMTGADVIWLNDAVHSHGRLPNFGC